MEEIIRYIKNLFMLLFRGSGNRYKRRLEAKVRAATVGKVQAKAMKARSDMDKKVFSAQDKMMPGNKKKELPKK